MNGHLSFVRHNSSSDGMGEHGRIAFLKDIEMLVRNPELNNYLLRIICGGTVHMDSNGKVIADNANFIISKLHSLLYKDEDTHRHFYSHTCMAMTPIGQHLCDIGSVFELVIIVYNARKAHATVLKE
ncbi:hypothetical protein COEREDRAFT_86247 [Coemansia reversa NRRL 1564]|uniref:Uncharacterized protein n=1 Tax=Coemansia reversa (strain ATCC 12441 / NRRL 1564) TaxID=763665 RepID=A0A2G5BE11_COERN|nr:hypothetical protein COEREDRAFT_86247 [Coemansia reversa NRRL 1564]|eukprot:PIA17248.1 hypothetical protein COEREDRAFT_86247 [Coemansia reversa NRRL 1564]